MDIESIRRNHERVARRLAASVNVERLAQIRSHVARQARRRDLSETAAQHVQAKLERRRAAGSVKGVRRVMRVSKPAGEA